jgi:hypothetical protein
VQTFFRGRALRRYFVVNASDNDSDRSIPREVADVVKERLAEWQLTRHAHEEGAQVMDAHVAKTDKTGWFKRTGWLEHFAVHALSAEQPPFEQANPLPLPLSRSPASVSASSVTG